MKILLLAPHPFFQARGTPIAVKAVLEFLGSRGHKVDLLTFHEGENLRIPNCRIYRIPRIPGIRNIRPGFSLKKVLCDGMMLAACLRMVRRRRYDLIHAVEESAFIAAIVQALTGIPYVYDMDSSLAEQLVATYPRLHFALPTFQRFEALAVRRSLGVLTVCAALEDVAHRIAPDKPVGRVEDITLLPPEDPSPNGDPIAAAERASAEGDPMVAPKGPSTDGDALLPPSLTGAGPIAMYVGNLEHYQGIDLLLEGFRYTLQRVPDAQLVIVGGRPGDIALYRARARTLGIHSRVHFLGPRPVALLDRLLRQADVLVSPRLRGLNTPMKIYSYLDSGRPVLATRLRTHTQVLDDRIAYLVAPAPKALGCGLAELLSNRALRDELARRAKAYVQREFTPEAARRKLGSFYTMIESKASGAGV